MELFERRALTGAELALAREIFGDEIAWARVRVVQWPPLFFWAMAPLRHTVLYSRLRARRDFSEAPLEEQGVFIHELAHIWQAAHGTVLAAAKLNAIGKRAYLYEAKKGARLGDYNIEAQAEIVRHLFMARRGASEPGAASADWLEAIWSGR
ncbi:MAG: vgr related protein [Pseudomonadota bacterium]